MQVLVEGKLLRGLPGPEEPRVQWQICYPAGPDWKEYWLWWDLDTHNNQHIEAAYQMDHEDFEYEYDCGSGKKNQYKISFDAMTVLNQDTNHERKVRRVIVHRDMLLWDD